VDCTIVTVQIASITSSRPAGFSGLITLGPGLCACYAAFVHSLPERIQWTVLDNIGTQIGPRPDGGRRRGVELGLESVRHFTWEHLLAGVTLETRPGWLDIARSSELCPGKYMRVRLTNSLLTT